MYFYVLFLLRALSRISFFFFFNDTATTEIYTLSLHDALPILYGWPQCFAERRAFLRDPSFAGAGGCRTMTLPSLELPPHAAPLGLVFYTGGQFPSEYSGDLFVALHGSRAGLPPAGYKIARVRFRHGHAARVEDFSTGWRHGDRVLRPPVDLVLRRDGSLYVSDDHAG